MKARSEIGLWVSAFVGSFVLHGALAAAFALAPRPAAHPPQETQVTVQSVEVDVPAEVEAVSIPQTETMSDDIAPAPAATILSATKQSDALAPAEADGKPAPRPDEAIAAPRPEAAETAAPARSDEGEAEAVRTAEIAPQAEAEPARADPAGQGAMASQASPPPSIAPMASGAQTESPAIDASEQAAAPAENAIAAQEADTPAEVASAAPDASDVAAAVSSTDMARPAAMASDIAASDTSSPVAASAADNSALPVAAASDGAIQPLAVLPEVAVEDVPRGSDVTAPKADIAASVPTEAPSAANVTAPVADDARSIAAPSGSGQVVGVTRESAAVVPAAKIKEQSVAAAETGAAAVPAAPEAGQPVAVAKTGMMATAATKDVQEALAGQSEASPDVAVPRAAGQIVAAQQSTGGTIAVREAGAEAVLVAPSYRTDVAPSRTLGMRAGGNGLAAVAPARDSVALAPIASGFPPSAETHKRQDEQVALLPVQPQAPSIEARPFVDPFQQVSGLIARRAGQGCFFAVAERRPDVVEVDGYAEQPESLQRLKEDLETISIAKARPHHITRAQCEALSFAQAISADGADRLRIRAESNEIRSGAELTGTIENLQRKRLSLVVVDDEGKVQEVESLEKIDVHTIKFRDPFTLTNGPVSTVQLLVAVASDEPLETFGQYEGKKAEPYFAALRREIDAVGAQVDIGIAAFVVR